ncbi:hypothetical protein PLESTM_000440200 [Pleodorina starrii]|nr:hypothetical protein PLESTM_000440200 [Pleodorina starrii]
MGRQRWPGADILDEARGRLAVYAEDWRDGINAGTRIIAPSTYIFLASLLPALAFGLQLDHETYGLLGVVQVLAATALGGVAQAVCGGQPLLIVGVAEPVVLIYAFLYRFAEGQEGLGRERFLPWAAWVVVVAAAGACRAVDALTRFSGELFGALIGILFLQQAVKGLIAQFRLDPNGLYGGDTSAGAGAGGGAGGAVPSPSSAAAAAVAVSDLFVWRLVNGLWSLLLAAALLLSCRAVLRARSWRFLRKVLLCTGISFAISPATSTQVPPGVPRRVASGDVWRGANPAAGGGDGGGGGGDGWRVASRMAEVPGGYVAAAALPAFVIAVLFYFDHSVSSQMAQQPEYNLVRPPSYAYDLALLGGMTLACGLLGLPPVNGVLPQAPMHTRSLATLGHPRAAKKQQHHHHGQQQQQKQQRQPKQQLEDEQQQQQQADEQQQQQQPTQQQHQGEEAAQQQGHDHRRQSAQEGLAPPSGPPPPGPAEGWETARAASGPPAAAPAAAAAAPANSTPAATMPRAVAAAAAAAPRGSPAAEFPPPAAAPPPRYWPGGLGVPAAAAAVNGGANQPTAAVAAASPPAAVCAAAAAAGCNGAGADGGSDGGAGRQWPQGQVVVVSRNSLSHNSSSQHHRNPNRNLDGASSHRHTGLSVRVFGVGDGGAAGGDYSCGLPDGAAEAPEEAAAVSRARLLSPCQIPSGPTSCPHEQARSGGGHADRAGGAGGGGVAHPHPPPADPQQRQQRQHQQQRQRERSGCCGNPAAAVAEATLPAAVAAAAAVPHGTALPLRVLEQRLSNLLQSLGVAACLFGTPAIRQIPQAALWGYFAVMAIESFQGSQLVDRVLLLLTDPARRPTLLRGPHAPYLETVPLPTIAAFTGLQVALLAGIWALVTWAGVGGIAFPLPIMALVPLRRYLLPRFFPPEHLRELDCAEYEQVPPASAPTPPPLPPPPPSHTPPLTAGALTPAVAPPPPPPTFVVVGGGEGGGGGGQEEEQTWPGPARFPAGAAAGALLQAPAQLLSREAAQAQTGEAAAPEPVGGFGGLEAAPAAVEARRRRAEVDLEEGAEVAAAAAEAVAADWEEEREIIEAEHVGVQPVHHLTRGQLRQRVGAAAGGAGGGGAGSGGEGGDKGI